MIIATHNGVMHADEVLAMAVLSELGLVDTIVRTRDEQLLAQADMRVDVGGIYDHDHKNYDHHQIGGAGVRPNGIPYASFGLIWKHYGLQLAGSAEAVAVLDREMAQPLDAEDTGLSGYKLVDERLQLYSLGSVINRFNPQWNETTDLAAYDQQFDKALVFAREVLRREVLHAKAVAEAESQVRKAINTSKAHDPRIVVLDRRYPWAYTVTTEAPEALYVVYAGEKDDDWRVQVVAKAVGSYEARKPLPASWAGLRDAAMAEASGVASARFCHTARFLAVAATQADAVRLAQIATAA